MVLRIFLFATAFLLIFCSVPERDNPNDGRSPYYLGESSSSSETLSSSSHVVSSSSSLHLSSSFSSSSKPSSSSIVPPSSSSLAQSSSSLVESSSSSMLSSSSSALPSSSSVAVSSSSAVKSSSSSLPSSSSSVPPSSSSVAKSSSSAAVSSSSSMLSSSSIDFCEGFTEGEERFHLDRNKPQFCDPRDGKRYVYVEIGDQTWMAENMNYNAPKSRCYGDDTGGDSQGNCAIYGSWYNWATAMANVCPSGWHLPSDAEWDALMTTVGGSSTAGKHLKARDGWNSCGPSGSGKTYSCEDTYGFSALPGGYGNFGGSFVGDIGYWWSSSENDANSAYSRNMYHGDESAYYYYGNKLFLFSVRCLQD